MSILSGTIRLVNIGFACLLLWGGASTRVLGEPSSWDDGVVLTLQVDASKAHPYGPVVLVAEVRNTGALALANMPPLQIRWGFLEVLLHGSNGRTLEVVKISDDPSYSKSGYTRGRVFRTLEPNKSFRYSVAFATTWVAGKPTLLFDEPGEYVFEAKFYNKGRTGFVTARSEPFHVTLPESADARAALAFARGLKLSAEVFGRAYRLTAATCREAEKLAERFPNTVLGEMASIALVRDKMRVFERPAQFADAQKELRRLLDSCWSGHRPEISALIYKSLRGQRASGEAKQLATDLISQFGDSEAVISTVDVNTVVP